MIKCWVAGVLLFLCSTLQAADYAEATGGESKVSVVVLEDYHGLLDLYEQLDYTDETWLAGDRHVPRLYLTSVPAQWGAEVSHAVTVALKKRLFFRTVGPLVLLAGATALRAMLGIRSGISQRRGQWHDQDQRAFMPVFHPSYLLRFRSREPGSPQDLTLQDLKEARRRLCRERPSLR